MPGREVTRGVHEVEELGPALAASLARLEAGRRVALEESLPLARWNRPTSEVDLVRYGHSGEVSFVVELKAWNIGHQLFDLAKVCCLLTSGVPAGFLMCVAKRAADFDRMPGGELFAAVEGHVREHDFVDLIGQHRGEWRRHVGKGGPEPTSVPARLTTTSVVADVGLEAYPGHAARAVEVVITDATPVPLRDGWPEGTPPS